MDQVLGKNPKVIESEITQQIVEMKNAGSSYSTVSVHLAALYHFFSINDVIINKKAYQSSLENRRTSMNIDLIPMKKFYLTLSLCDERGKAIVLLMASTGMRVGPHHSKLRRLWVDHFV